MSRLFYPTVMPMPVWFRRGLRTLNAAVMLMLLAYAALFLLYVLTHLGDVDMIAPDPVWPVNQISPGGSTPPAGH